MAGYKSSEETSRSRLSCALMGACVFVMDRRSNDVPVFLDVQSVAASGGKKRREKKNRSEVCALLVLLALRQWMFAGR